MKSFFSAAAIAFGIFSAIKAAPTGDAEIEKRAQPEGVDVSKWQGVSLVIAP